MLRYALRIDADKLLNNRKQAIKHHHQLPYNKRENKHLFQHWIDWDSHRAMYLRQLSMNIDKNSFNPDAKQLTNMWVALRVEQGNLLAVAGYDATDTLNDLMKQLKIVDSQSKQDSLVNTHSINKELSHSKKSTNQTKSINILLFINKHIHHLNISQIMRGIRTWCNQKYSKANYFNQLLPKNINVYSMNFLNQKLQHAIDEMFKKGQITESVKYTKMLNQIKSLHVPYFMIKNDSLLVLNHSKCKQIIELLLKLSN